MDVPSRVEELKKLRFFSGLNDSELAQVANIAQEHSYTADDLCQIQDQPTNRIQIILKGRVGAVYRIRNVTHMSSEIIISTLGIGDVFGWSSLIKTTPWSTLKAVEPTDVLIFEAAALQKLYDENNRIGYILMRNLSSVMASKLKSNRISMLNTLVALRGE